MHGDKHVLVVDQHNHRAVVFNQDGALVLSLACAERPVELAVDQKGELLVACSHGMSRYFDVANTHVSLFEAEFCLFTDCMLMCMMTLRDLLIKKACTQKWQ